MAESPADDERSYYALLGVSPGATDDEIKRAYRQLATTLHPDKVANAAHHDEAALLFTRMQEAYEVGGFKSCIFRMAFQQHLRVLVLENACSRFPQRAAVAVPPAPLAASLHQPPILNNRFAADQQVLSDPQKRDIYDVYGKEGLSAGLQVQKQGRREGRKVLHLLLGTLASSVQAPCHLLQLGDKLKTREELRAEWEAFQQQQKKAELEASVNYRGVYQFKIDATGGRRRPVACSWASGLAGATVAQAGGQWPCWVRMQCLYCRGAHRPWPDAMHGRSRPACTSPRACSFRHPARLAACSGLLCVAALMPTRRAPAPLGLHARLAGGGAHVPRDTHAAPACRLQRW